MGTEIWFRTEGRTDGGKDGRRQNYIPPTLSGDNNYVTGNKQFIIYSASIKSYHFLKFGIWGKKNFLSKVSFYFLGLLLI